MFKKSLKLSKNDVIKYIMKLIFYYIKVLWILWKSPLSPFERVGFCLWNTITAKRENLSRN